MSITFSTKGLIQKESHVVDVDFFLPADDLDEKLNFLKKFKNGEFPPSPFTEPQTKILQEARKWEHINSKTLKWGLVFCIVLAAAQALLQLKPVQDWANSSYPKTSAIFTVGICCSVVGVAAGYIATGNLPDKASRASIQASEELADIKECYEEIADHLLTLYKKNQKMAEETAEELSMVEIQGAMEKSISSREAGKICKSLIRAKKRCLHNKSTRMI